MTGLVLKSPLAGWAAPLAEIPDPVFAGGMMGEGAAIDPTGEAMYAPCDAVVLKVHAARHAVTLRTDEGADLLIHLGVDTVALGGEGLTVHVSDGQRVKTGDRLVSFDLDALAQRAPSLMSPVIVTNPEAFAVRLLRTGCEVSVGDPLIELTPAKGGPVAATRVGSAVVRQARITHPHGLHARPAALIAAEARRAVGEVQLKAGSAHANARSPVALMALGVAPGDEVEISASGPGAESVVAGILDAIARINAAPSEGAALASPAQRPAADGKIRGVRAAPGRAVGVVWRRAVAEAPLRAKSAGEAAEASAFDAALAVVAADLAARGSRLAGETRAIVEAHMALLEDPELIAAARRGVASGASAGVAWRDAAQAYAGVLAGTGDTRLAARAADLKDLEQQVLWALAGRAPDPPKPPKNAILVAQDILPSELIALADADLAGLCTAGGGPTSHVAVLAATRGLPALVAAGPVVLEIAEGATVILDADDGLLDPAPNAADLADARKSITARTRARTVALAAAAEPGRTGDGVRIEVLANVGAAGDATLAAAHGAEGCGLLRTEFLFLDRPAPPDEAEQLAAYQQVVDALAGRPVTVRTLDVGGDKPAAYLSLPAEENPALGVRGVRVSLRTLEMLRGQLRAILRVTPPDACRIMVPMVASVAEIAAVRRELVAVAKPLRRPVPALGVMIETPAAALSIDLLAAEADFVSIGTNDLAQYVLAMDRGHPALAAEVDALHPAVLRLIRTVAQGAEAANLPLSVCGGLASDPAAVPILIGLGVRALSVAPAVIPEIKAGLRCLTLGAAQDLAKRACAQTSAAEVRALKLKAAVRRRQTKGASA